MTHPRLVVRCLAALLALLAAAWNAPAFAQAGADRVTDVAVVGNANISREAILGPVSIQPGTPFSPEAVERDVAAIRDLGYFVTVTHREELVGTGIRVIFEVVENPRVTGISITGNTKIPTADLLEAMTTKTGDVLNVPRFRKDIDRIQQLYRERGYLAYVDINATDYITPEGVLNIPIVEVKVEKITVERKGKTRENTILREVRTKPGSVYNATELRADLLRIYNLGILEDIQYSTEPGTQPDQIIIVLQPAEGKTGQVDLGFGYSSQQGLIGRAGVSERNFRGTGAAIGLSGEVGGRYRSSGVPPLSVEANYYQPYIDRRRTSFSGSLYNKTTYRFTSSLVGTGSANGDAYEVRRGGSIGFGRPLSDTRRLQLSLRNDSIKTYSGDRDLSLGQEIIDNQRTSNVASVGLSWVTDTRDDRQYDPAKGHFFTVGAETGFTRLGGDSNLLGLGESRRGGFVKPALDYRRYISLVPRKAINTPTRVLAFRVKAGSATGPISFFDQYFVGGADSLRGFRDDRFWGKNSVLFNAELRWPFANSLQGVLFFDAGDAWGSGLRGNPDRYADYLNWINNNRDSNGDGIPDPAPLFTIYDSYEYNLPQHNSLSLHTGMGFGIRVKTPIGPIRLDYGISKEGRRTHFSIAQTF